MDKAYEAKKHEESIYRMWEEGGYFTPSIDKKKKPFSILLPLPNANDPMHMGHALFTVEDIMIRYHRMRGVSDTLASRRRSRRYRNPVCI